MHALLLAVALSQVPGTAQATPSDTVLARMAIDSATAALRSVEGGAADYGADRRLLVQVRLWSDEESAWRFAWEADSGVAATGRGQYPMTKLILGDMLREGDVTALRYRLTLLPRQARDEIVASMLNYLGSIPAWAGALLDSLATTPVVRARLMHARSLQYRRERDSATASDTLAAAIAMVLQDTAAVDLAVQWTWLLRDYGGDVSLDDLIHVTRLQHRLDQPDSALLVRSYVAESLKRRDATAAAALADSALSQFPPHSPAGRRTQASLLEVRGAPGDSARARALRDSVRQEVLGRATAPIDRSTQFTRPEFMNAINGRDSAAVSAVLDRVRSDPEASWMLRWAVDGQATLARRSVTASQVEWSAWLLDRFWPLSAGLPQVARDSVRASFVGLLATLDPHAAVDSANAIARQPMRDRAVAEAIRAFAAIDVDSAAAIARTLREDAARNVAFIELTRRAIAGGRLDLAADLAASTAGGEARVQAQFELGNALAAGGRREGAATAIANALTALAPLPTRGGLWVGGQPGPERMSPRLIHNVGRLAIELGLRDELIRWASRAAGPRVRAAAWTAVAEAVAQAALGWQPTYGHLN